MFFSRHTFSSVPLLTLKRPIEERLPGALGGLGTGWYGRTLLG